MDWVIEHWSWFAIVGQVVVIVLLQLGKTALAKVVEALVMAIETQGGKSTKLVAKANAATGGVSTLLKEIVIDLTEGGES